MAQQCFTAKLQAKEQPTAPQSELPIDLDARDNLVREHARSFEDLVDVPLRKKKSPSNCENQIIHRSNNQSSANCSFAEKYGSVCLDDNRYA